MDKNLLEELQMLSESLKDVSSIDSNSTISNIRDSYERAEENLLYLQTSLGTEVLVPGSISEEEYERILQERIDLEDEYLRNARVLEKLKRQTSNFERALKNNEIVYNLSKNKVEELQRELSERENLSNEDRDIIERKIAQAKKAMEETNANNEDLNKRLAVSRKKTDEVSAIKEELKAQMDQFERPKYEYKIVTEEDIKLAELDAQTLHFAYNFFSANPKEEIDKTINDYNSGLIDEKTLNERLQNLKVLLTSGLYKDYFAKLKEERELRDKRISEIEKEIELQKELVLKENKISEIDEKIEYYQHLIDSDLDNKFASRYKIMIKQYQEKRDNLLVNGIGADKLSNLEDLHLSLLIAKKASENDLDLKLERLIEKTGGQTLVESSGRQVPSYFPSRLLEILDENEAKKINERVDEVLNKKIDEVQKADPSIEINKEELVEKINEKVEEKESDIENQIEENSKNEELVPVNSDIVNGPLIEVKDFEEVEKSKLDKIKEFFSKKWKKVVSSTLLIGLSATLLFTSLCSQKKKNAVEDINPQVVEFTIGPTDNELESDEDINDIITPTETPTLESTPEPTVAPEETPTPARTTKPKPTATPDPTPTQTPFVRPPEAPEEIPDIDIPNPGVTPAPTVTPEPTQGPQDPLMDGRNLNTGGSTLGDDKYLTLEEVFNGLEEVPTQEAVNEYFDGLNGKGVR